MVSLLIGTITHTDARGNSLLAKIDFRLVGSIIVENGNSYAIIEDEITGKQSIYTLGDSINGATVFKINKESIILVKNEQAHILMVTGGSHSESTPPETVTEIVPFSIDKSDKFPSFEPVFSMTGPAVDEYVAVKELPYFNPITNNTGPEVHEGPLEAVP